MLGSRFLNLFSVSASLFLLIAHAPKPISSLESRWPYNLPPHVKHFPGDENTIRKNWGVQRRLATQKAVGVRKMKDDEGEMFFPEYWQFDIDKDNRQIAMEADKKISEPYPPRKHGGSVLRDKQQNVTLLHTLLTPFMIHTDKQLELQPVSRRLSLLHRGLFSPRDFQCPGDTFSCTSINRANSCCPNGQSCQLIDPDPNGLGDVGCCAAGLTCSQQLSGCQDGYTSCPGSSGGGCCIPGYECDGIGCALVSTATVFVNPTVTASPPSSTSTIQSTSTTSSSSNIATVTGLASPSISISSSSEPPSTTSITSTISITALTSSSTSATLSCSSGFRSCAPSLGGGCCPTDRACGPSSCPASSGESSSSSTITTDPNLVIPVRPTSNVAATITSTFVSTAPGDTCPTGFYQCSAYYHGGCCRVGRDCDLTSCPASASTTVANTNGIVIVAPTGPEIGSAGPLLGTGSCAQGWLTCAANDGGGCCPSGYVCGQSCTATATGAGATAPAVEEKSATGKGVALHASDWEWRFRLLVTLAITLGVGFRI